MNRQSTTLEPPAGELTIRPATIADGQSCAEIFYDAFAAIATQHSFPIEPGSPMFTRYRVSEMLATEGCVGLVADRNREVLGSAFIDERSLIAGIGPVTVAPAVQDQGVGRALMEAALERVRERQAPGVRLVQTAYHYRSLALYSTLGFAIREPLSVLQGTPPAVSVPGRAVRPARTDDLEACGALCERIHGHDRNRELADAINAQTAHVVERPEQISGYATGFGYGWHAVAETNEDLIALLGSAAEFMGLGVLIPSRSGALLRWCLDHGLRIIQQSTLMTIGLYSEPTGAWLPSIVY